MISGMQNAAASDADLEPPAYPIASVDRALRVLLLIARTSSLRLSEVSQALGVAPSTAHRLLAMLIYHGFVRQDQSLRAYVAGPAFVEIALRTIKEADVSALARPIMEGLAAATHETVHLSVLEGRIVRYIDAIESTRALRVAARTGRTLPANCSAAGKALLAELPPGVVERTLGPGPLEAATGRSITQLAALQLVLDRVRRSGYAINLEESEEGVASIATPIRDPRGHAVAALSVGTPVARMEGGRRHELVRLLRAAADEIEASFRERAGVTAKASNRSAVAWAEHSGKGQLKRRRGAR